jgi:hypothetical protein
MRTSAAVSGWGPPAVHGPRSARAHPRVLRFGPGALVVVAGLPGAGKTTLLRRVGPSSGAVVHDPELLRDRLPGRVPYALLRPTVHLWHRRRVRRDLRRPGALLVHEPAFRPGGRRWLLRAAARAGRPVHLLVVGAGPDEARDGQQARGRRVGDRRFAAHVRGARALGVRAPGDRPRMAGVTDVVVLPRPAAARLAAIRFDAPAARPTGRPEHGPATGPADRSTVFGSTRASGAALAGQ